MSVTMETESAHADMGHNSYSHPFSAMRKETMLLGSTIRFSSLLHYS